MAVKRLGMGSALIRPQTVQRQALTVPRINTTATSPLGDNANSLQQEAYGQALINKAVGGQGFDPQGGWGVAAAQIATAGIGAWAQNKARKDIAEKEVNRQTQLSSLLTSKGYTPESANAIASMTTPDSGASLIGAFVNQDMAKNDPATQLGLQKTQAEIAKLNAEAGKARSEASGKTPDKAPAGYRFQQDGNLEAIPGGPAGKLSAESAGKVALIKQGEMDSTRFRDLISEKDSKGNITGYKTGKLAGLGIYGTPGAREEYSTLYNAINARLRLESGAAVPEAEVKRALKTFAPNATDSNKTIKSKLDRLDEFFGIAKQEIGQGRGATPPQSGFKVLNMRDK